MAKASNKRSSHSNKPAQPRATVQHSTNVKGFLKHGNKDADKEHDLTDMRVRPDQYVVRHFSTFASPTGVEMEDPGSSRLQVYDKEDFDRLNKQNKSKDGKQEPSHFENMGLGIDILHEPE